jgi:hypothetical protein
MKELKFLWMELSKKNRFSFIDVFRIFIIIEITKYFIN